MKYIKTNNIRLIFSIIIIFVLYISIPISIRYLLNYFGCNKILKVIKKNNKSIFKIYTFYYIIYFLLIGL
jgi:hypothetical protein